MWRHFETSSSRLFNKVAQLALAIINFSYKHKSHFVVPQIYGCAFIALNQSIVWFLQFSFNFHMQLESSVHFCRDLFLKDDVWLLYFSLKLFSQFPKQFFAADVFTTALYTKHSERQFFFWEQYCNWVQFY